MKALILVITLMLNACTYEIEVTHTFGITDETYARLELWALTEGGQKELSKMPEDVQALIMGRVIYPVISLKQDD